MDWYFDVVIDQPHKILNALFEATVHRSDHTDTFNRHADHRSSLCKIGDHLTTCTVVGTDPDEDPRYRQRLTE
jgi:hypothetical protein